jgi:2-oxoglutarate dehydrogenase E1 component
MLDHFELEHWQLSELDSISQYQLDYRSTQTLTDKVGTCHDLKAYLERTYTSNITAEFEHVKDEDQRNWLYQNYEKCLNEEVVTNEEKLKALQLLHRAE